VQRLPNSSRTKVFLPDQDPDAANAGAGKHHGKHHSSETQQQGYGGYSIESQQGQQGQGYDKSGYGQQQGSYDRPVSGGYGQQVPPTDSSSKVANFLNLFERTSFLCTVQLVPSVMIRSFSTPLLNSFAMIAWPDVQCLLWSYLDPTSSYRGLSFWQSSEDCEA